MKLLAFEVAGIVAMLTLSLPVPAPGSPDDRSTVAQLDLEFQAAVKRNDAVAMDRILHDSYVLVLGNGRVVSRDELLQEARNRENTYEQQDEVPGSQTVRVWGDTAVVTAELRIKGTGKKGPFDRKLWFSDTYVRTSSGWRYAFGQASLSLPPDESPAAASAGSGAPDAEVDAVSQAFDDAQFRKDSAALDRFLAPDFRFVRGSGKFTDREEFIAIFADPAIKFEPFVITGREVIMLGPDAAIVSAEGAMRGTGRDNRPFSEHFRYADTFERRAGQWQVVYVQVTPMKPPD